MQTLVWIQCRHCCAQHQPILFSKCSGLYLGGFQEGFSFPACFPFPLQQGKRSRVLWRLCASTVAQTVMWTCCLGPLGFTVTLCQQQHNPRGFES